MGPKMLMVVVWPAFLAACLLEAAVFAVVDPLDLTWGHGPLGWSRQAAYTVAFFLFWGVTALAAMEALRSRGLWVPAIRPPTVPKETARLRISLSAAHTEQDVRLLIETLQQAEAELLA